MNNSLKTMCAAASLLAASGIAYAQDSRYSGDQLRVDLSLNSLATIYDDGFDELIISESSLDGLLTFQAGMGFYGQVGYSRLSLEGVEFNGLDQYHEDESTNVVSFGVGYRFNRQVAADKYWGLGYQNTKMREDGAEAADAFRIFWEKNNERRYGVIDIKYSTVTDFDALSVSGRHVWFGSGGIGGGVTWGLGSGEYDSPAGYSNVDVGTGHLGFILMFRP